MSIDITGDTIYEWREAPVPEGLPVAQVYGYLICPVTNRVLITEHHGVFNLPGGSPEPEDKGDMNATLARECLEECQTRFDDAAFLGHQEVRQPGKPPLAQVRMVARISTFEPRHPDPDDGRLFRRLMTSLIAAPALLGWGQPAIDQTHAAARQAHARWGLDPARATTPGYID